MSQNSENDQDTPQTDAARDLVGDILRKERITRRITVDTIAKDLKLNVKYIKSLESNEYDQLPADPYVRVYLKSLAKYLSLDSDAILKQFYQERGLTSDTPHDDKDKKIKISMQHKEESHSPMIAVAIVIIALLALLSMIAKKQGWIANPTINTLTTPAPDDDEFSSSDALNGTTMVDSLIPAPPPIPADTDAVVSDSSNAVANADTTKKLSLRFDIIKDSVWVQVYSDGQSWKNVVTKRKNRHFSANDSFNIHVGNNELIKYTLNGKRFRMRGTGVMVFKIDHTGKPTVWTLSKWNSIFKNRM